MTQRETFALRPDRAPIDAEELRHLAGPVFGALEHSGLAMVVTDPHRQDNPIVFVNPAFAELTGYPPEELLGRNCRMLQGPGTDRQAVAEIADAVAARRRVEVEILNYRKSGERFWNRMFITPVQDANGQTVFFLSSQLDVTAAYVARATQAELRERQSRLERVNESLQQVLAVSGAAATWEWQIPERRLVGDAGFAALHGLSPDAAADGVSTQVFFANIHPQDRDRIRLSVGGMLRGAEVFSKEFRIVTPAGAIRWVHGRGRCSFDADDHPARFSGVLVDITEQKRLEEKLRIAQSAGGVGTFEHVEGFATVSVSAQFCRLLGLHPAADLPVRTVNAVVHRDDPPIIDTAAGPTTASDPDARRRPGPAANAPASGTGRVEFRVTRADDGEERWLVRCGEHLQDADAVGSRFSGVIYDITEAKRIEAQLRTMNETLETRVAERTRERDRIWRVSQDLLGVADADGRWCSINPAWTALLGWVEAEIVGRTLGWLQHPDDAAEAAQEFRRAAAAERTFAFENRLRRRDGGYRWLSWTAVPEQGLIYCVGRDVTAEKETAEALRQVEEKLRQSQKMEAVGQLTGGLAHDFNNLLTGITGSLELMQARIRQGRVQDVERYISAAEGAARRAASLTHRLLAFSRQQTLDPRPTDLDRLVAGMEELVRRTMGPGITVEVTAGRALWRSFVDPNQLENALLNLCINARDAMAGGGRLLIETENVSLDAAAAREFDLAAGDYVTLSVSDTGAGMTPEVMARAFDPFFTTKPLGQGTGLGLSMIYGFARQSGGHVRIESMPGFGTTVSIHLPRHFGGGDETAVPAEARESPAAGQGETVLVVDDEGTVRMLLADVLQDLGYTPIEAADGVEALEVLQTDTRIDLLITDVGLPGGMNGRQVAERARELRPGLKVLFITGYAENAVLGSGDLAPGMHVLSKPFAIDILSDRIRHIIVGR
jgi:PAS domain S-box-containing protein